MKLNLGYFSLSLLQILIVEILGKIHEATILEESPYDPENKLLRA